jgi:nucleotide-binding universal stress UspA family protein
MTIENLLVTTDFSPAARTAYGCGAELATKFGAALHLAHVEDLPSSFLEPPADYFDEIAAALREEANDRAFEGARVVPHFVRGRQPFVALRELTKKENIGVLVTATHGRTGLDRFLLGSFAERLVRTAIVPVLVCRQNVRAGTTPVPVLVPSDFSEQSRAVLPMVRLLAAHYHCRFTFLHVREPRSNYEPLSTRLRNLMGGSAERIEQRFAELTRNELAELEADL